MMIGWTHYCDSCECELGDTPYAIDWRGEYCENCAPEGAELCNQGYADYWIELERDSRHEDPEYFK